MRSHFIYKSGLRIAALATAMLFVVNAAFAAPTTTTVNLIAKKMSTTLPDGNTVPMWGLCTTDTPGTASLGGATLGGSACSAAATQAWAPGPTITIPYDATNGNQLTINLTNNLATPTSIVILGQIGGGLGSPNKQASPVHSSQLTTTWPATGVAGDSPVFTPPAQGLRARSFSPEAAANGGTQVYTWSALKPGTYLYETGTHPSIQAPMGLYGVLIVTAAPQAATSTTPAAAGHAYSGVTYDADATLLFSEIDPKQNAAVDATPIVSGLIDENKYPPAVNYSPRYFLINGHSFDRTAPDASVFAVPAQALSGNVLVRLVNAGLRTHIPSFVNLPMSLVAEDGNVAPGNYKIQTEALLTAGKTIDALVNPAINAGSYLPSTYGVFDRQLSLSTGTQPGGMQGILQVAGGALPTALQCAANNDNFSVAVNSATFSGNVLTNDTGIIQATLGAAPTHGSVQLNNNGTFTYTPTTAPVTADTFTYSGQCSGGQTFTATVALNVTALGGAPTANADSFTSNTASLLKVKRPGVLGNDTDPAGYKLTAALDSASANLSVILNPDGSFTATPANVITAPTTLSFTYHAVNAQGTASAPTTVTLNFNKSSGVQVTVIDTQDHSIAIGDYSWTIEEDITWYHDPKNPAGAGNGTPPMSLATNFHKSYMPLVATGCTGPRSCGDTNTVTINGVQQPVTQKVRMLPSDVVLDANKRYYISVLPGDAIDGDPDQASFGHTIGGAPIAPGQKTVTVLSPRNALPGGQISVIVFEDNNPTNSSIDNNEPGLGDFTINLFDTRGSSGDPAGQMTYDLSGMPMTNSLFGTKSVDGLTDLCPGSAPTGVIITCPELDSDGNPSPLAGMALIKNINPGRYDVTATPGAAREGRGENWIQVSTLEGTRNNDTFIKPGEPGYWQEFGSPGFHAFIGFVNPDHVKAVNTALHATNTVTGKISSLHMDRPPGVNLNDSCATSAANDPTCRASLAFTTCQVSINTNSGSGANVSYAQCDSNGNFTLTGVPSGTNEIVIWDQWLDQIIAFKAVTVPAGDNQVINVGTVPVFAWFTRIEQSAFVDLNQNGVRDDGEPGIAQIPTNIRFRDGSISNYIVTDSNGNGVANELFPLFNWYVVESDTTRFKGTGVNVTYDAGGKPDTTGKYAGVLNSTETDSLPASMQVPLSTYTAGKTNRIDAGTTLAEGVQGFVNQTAIIDWGKTPYSVGENGGITGMVYYASTRGSDDPRLEVQFSWEPAVPRVPVNLYQSKRNADGTQSLVLIDTTTTSSWDDAAASMHCPGQSLSDPFITWTLGAANQFKCYDGMHVFNQVQPAVYDGRYRFPSPAYLQAHPAGLAVGKYVVEVVLPAGYEIVKEEDKNILAGDGWLSPSAATQFAGISNIFILPDQATLNDANSPGAPINQPPCVGETHRVPDYLTLFPELGQNAPYAGQDRPLCDRKEITLNDQMQAAADFQVFTPAPIAAHFTGMMLNDTAAEFDPTSLAFGEKAALPNAPVSFRDYNGVEIMRVYNDKWGTFNGLTPSTWAANVPNPSGYAPNMLTSCMNDPGPIPDPSGAIDPATGKVKMIIDPAYNPMFSNFCYVWPYMPGLTTYLDTPVLPTAAFASESGNNPLDCQYPDATPAVSRVDGNGAGVDQYGNAVHGGPYVDMNPSAPAKTLTITALGDMTVLNPAYAGPNAQTPPTNQPTIVRHYGFGSTPGTVSLNGLVIPAANITQWTDSKIVLTVPNNATTGELVITAANGKSSIDSVTVTIESSNVANYRKPVYVSPPVVSSSTPEGLAHPIQDAIDAAKPGDLILLGAGSYPELVIMWKPVRLQGVAAPSVMINATKYPNRKLADWRTRINALFGIDSDGNVSLPVQVDPLPGQEIIGGIVQLEPSVLGAEEGAGITVVAKGLKADGVTPLTGSNADCNYSASNFRCGASRIDGITVTGGDGGGGIYVNGWAHTLEIANNRVYGNAGPLSGGVRIGQPYLEGQVLTATGGLGYNVNVNVHNNAISTNGTVESNVGASGAGGGLSICAGSDRYKVTGNWVCGNFSSGDGGGIGHIGWSMNGVISNNKILFNESYNQTATQNGGGLVIEGEPGNGTTLTLGSGDVTVDGNLIQGNFARAGNGGGIRLQNVNGQDVANQRWKVRVTNNMIVNNLAGWAGGGISLSDTLFSAIINNTVASNDSTGIVGPVFNTMVNGNSTGPVTAVPSPAGVSSELTSALLVAALPSTEQAANTISTPNLHNNVIWQNRSFFFDASSGSNKLIASNDWNDAVTHSGSVLPPQTATGQCVSGAKYWDLGVVGDHSPTPGGANLHLLPHYSVLTANIAGYPTTGNKYTDPKLVKQYCNGSLMPPSVQGQGWPFKPDFQMDVASTLDESGNFVDLNFGPLSLMDPVAPTNANGNYHLADTTSSAYNAGNATGAPNIDYDGQGRPQGAGYDIGADELVVTPAAVSFNPNPVAFGVVPVNTVATKVVTITNSGGSPLIISNVAVSGTRFAKTADSCIGQTIAVGASCQVTVSFNPNNTTVRNGALTITDNGTGSPQSVMLTGS